MKIKVTSRGFYDTSHDYKVALLKEGDLLTVMEPQPPLETAKTGLWCHAEPFNVFVETENFTR